jgi:hypothetical protein
LNSTASQKEKIGHASAKKATMKKRAPNQQRHLAVALFLYCFFEESSVRDLSNKSYVGSP